LKEMRGDRLACLITVHREPEIKLIGHRNGLAGQQRPRLAIITRETAEQIPNAIEAQPGVG